MTGSNSIRRRSSFPGTPLPSLSKPNSAFTFRSQMRSTLELLGDRFDRFVGIITDSIDGVFKRALSEAFRFPPQTDKNGVVINGEGTAEIHMILFEELS